MMPRFLLAFALFLSYVPSVFSAQIPLAWDPPLTTSPAGYKVYYGMASRTYGPPLNVGNVTSYTLTGLTQGQTYFIAVTDYDASNLESGYSNEVIGVAIDPTQTYSYGFTSNPAGMQITIDATTYTAPQTFNWAGGSSHTISVPSPQGGTGSRYIFTSWSDGGAQNHTITVPSSNTTYTASFKTQFSLTSSASPSGGGTVNPTGMNWYDSGQAVSVSASANAGYSFSSWTGDLTGSTNPASLTMSGPKSATANFTQNQYPLTASISPSGSGSVTKNPTKATYVYGDQETLTASANAGYTFSNWTGDASGTTNPVILTINGNKAVTASFTTVAETVSTPTVPSGPISGVTGASYSYATGGSTSNLGHTVEYQFDWKGDGTDLSGWGPSAQSKTWTVAGVYQVRARARCATDTGVVSSWSNGLSVTISQATVSCTVATIPSGLQVAVDGTTYAAPKAFSWVPGSSHTISVLSPQSGSAGTQYVFASWSDGGGQSHTITAPSSATTYTVNFNTQYSLTTSANPAGGGTVSPSGVNWYNSGQNVSVSATLSAGYIFSGWAGDLTGSTNPSSLTMTGPKSVTANFAQNQYTLTVGVGPSGSGTIAKGPDKSTYASGDQVNLTATANSGYSFSNWTGDASGTTNPVTLTVNGNKTVTANFVNSVSLVVSPSGSLNASGTQGGPFSPSSQTYTLQNKGTNPLNWTVTKGQSWVSLSSKSGSLSPGGTVSVKVSINNNANQLKTGSFNDTIVFRNTANVNETVSRPVTLTINILLESFTVKTSPAGLQVTVDGTTYTAPQTFTWAVGSPHTLTAPSPQNFPGVQYIFNSWSFWSRRNHGQTITAPYSGATYTAYFTSQPVTGQPVNSSRGGIGTLSGAGSVDHGDIGSPNEVRFVSGKTTALPLIGQLESPSEGERVYGIKTIYGWALDGEGISKVNLYIDGVFVCDIPYGGLTKGLREAYPNYPNAEQGGFALVWDYSNLSPGSHLIQIEVENLRGDILNFSANLFVNKLSGETINEVNPNPA